MSGDDRGKQACAYLRMLLLRPGEYRTAWRQRATQPSSDEIDYVAVASVLAGASAPAGSAGAATAVDDRLVQTAQHALEGTALSAETLRRFVDAFSLRPRQAQRLQALLRVSEAVRVITDEVRPPRDLDPDPEASRHETLALHELHVLGPDGLPAEHQTIQVIRSKIDGLESLPYRFDTDELVVEVVRGGRVGDRIRQITDTLYAIDIILARPLDRGETTLLQYRSTFFYKAPPPPEFRRGVLSTTKDVTMWVTFHRDRLPKRVWLARWDSLDHARILGKELVELDDELSVHTRYDSVERAIIGFYWEWD